MLKNCFRQRLSILTKFHFQVKQLLQFGLLVRGGDGAGQLEGFAGLQDAEPAALAVDRAAFDAGGHGLQSSGVRAARAPMLPVAQARVLLLGELDLHAEAAFAVDHPGQDHPLGIGLRIDVGEDLAGAAMGLLGLGGGTEVLALAEPLDAVAAVRQLAAVAVCAGFWL